MNKPKFICVASSSYPAKESWAVAPNRHVSIGEMEKFWDVFDLDLYRRIAEIKAAQ